MNKATQTVEKQDVIDKASLKDKLKKVTQATILSVLTFIWAEHITATKAHAGLKHAQQVAELRHEQIEARGIFLAENKRIWDATEVVWHALNTVDPRSKEALPYLERLNDLQKELVALCTAYGKFSDQDKKAVSQIDELFNVLHFTPSQKWESLACNDNECKP